MIGRASAVLPDRRELYYGGEWRPPAGGYAEDVCPVNGESLGQYAVANSTDVDNAARAAHAAFGEWRRVSPAERSSMVKSLGAVIREHAEELALIDAVDNGSPVRAHLMSNLGAAHRIEYFAGLATEVKGETLPTPPGMINLTVREPWGVCARVVAYNHPFSFLANKLAAPLIAGNTVILKAAPQTPLTAYRLAELVDDLLPRGVVNVLTGDVECGQALVSHPLIPVVTLVGSAPTGRAFAKGAAERLKPTLLELGGKNAFIVYPDADIRRAVSGAVQGMNFGVAGQSCGSTSRLFLHESVYDDVLAGICAELTAVRPSDPTDMNCTMGALVSRAQFEKVMAYIDLGIKEGARLVLGGRAGASDPVLSNGFFVEPTIFADVTMDMRIAREEIFGPVLSVLKWNDEEEMLRQVNDVEYGLTAAIHTTSLARAHYAASRVDAGYIWVNTQSQHVIGAPFGGYKQSGVGREESLDELMAFTQVKNITMVS